MDLCAFASLDSSTAALPPFSLRLMSRNRIRRGREEASGPAGRTEAGGVTVWENMALRTLSDTRDISKKISNLLRRFVTPVLWIRTPFAIPHRNRK